MLRLRRVDGAAVAVLALLIAGGAGPTSVAADPGPPPTSGAAIVDDPATATVTARRTGRQVEILSERTETARVFANPSGTRTLEEYVLPVRTRRGDAWVPIDTRLVRAADGTVVPGATAVGMRLSGGGAGPLVTAVRDGKELSLTWPAPLPAPVLAGDTATYPEVVAGVDLRVRVGPAGFVEELVAKNARAAANPALRRIRFRSATKGLTVRDGVDGSIAALDGTGRAVFVSGTPLTSTGGAATVRPARREVRGGELTVLPDEPRLSGSATGVQLYVSQSFSAAQYRWTMVSEAMPDTSYWTDSYYREDMRVGRTYGVSDDNSAGPWRTLFQVGLNQLAGAKVSRAWVSISLIHSGSCTATPVELWQTRTIDPATPLNWRNSANHWLGGKALDTRNGKANKPACGQSPLLMEFGISPDTVTPVVQQAVNGAQDIAFGLRIPAANEDDKNYWKRFNETTARLNVEYDTPPRAPTGVTTVPPTACGTDAAPIALPTATPTFTGAGYDPNADNVTNHLEILSGETVLTSVASGTVGSTTGVRWPPVPGGVLPTSQPDAMFSYRARTSDGTLSGPYGARCYFTVDTARPTAPVVTSTDFPPGTPLRAVGETGTVTFTAAAGDTDLVGFRYGFDAASTTMWVAAGSDGTATVPVTLWPQSMGDTFDVYRTLYVRAVDRAGNASTLSPGWSLAARGRAVTTSRVRGDVTGDRRADVTAVVDHGFDRTAVWNLVAGPTGFHPAYVGWDTDVSGGFPVVEIRSVTGDFDGDGRTDVAIFREDPDRMVRLFLLRSDGSRYQAASEPVWTGSGFRLSHLALVAGDFDADGDDDLAEFQGLTGGQTKLWLHVSNRGQFGAPVLQWDSGVGGLRFAQVHPVAGDFDGDGDDDVADLVDAGGGQARLWVHVAGQGRLAAPAERWASTAGSFDTGRVQLAAGDVDAAGGDDVIALYDDGNAAARLLTIGERGGAWSAATWWTGAAGSLDAGRATLSAGDYNADGRADAAAWYDTGAGMRRLYTFASTGTAFSDKQSRWEGYVSDARPTVRVDSTRRYRIQPVHTGKCLDVPGGKTDNSLVVDQWDCVDTATWETFRPEQLGGIPYVRFRTAPADKCLDIRGWSLVDGGQVIQYTCATTVPNQPNQLFRLDYLSGAGPDMVVQLRNLHSDRCLQVSGASTANGAQIVQAACSALPPTHQQFYLRVEP
ncbi:RICIN domain-containing protein [Micromonospora rubida]